MCTNISNKLKVIVGILLLFLKTSLLFSQTTASLIPKKGLHVTTNNISWITGSEINFFTSDKKQHHYYFTWWEQDAYSPKSGNDQLFIGSKNTAVDGVYQLEQEDTKVNMHFDCKWNLKDDGLADIVYAKIWLPYLKEAKWSSVLQSDINDWKLFNEKTLFATTAFGTFKFTASHPFKVRLEADLQPGIKEYSKRSQYMLLYDENILVTDSFKLQRSFMIEEVKAVQKFKKSCITKSIDVGFVKNVWTANVQQSVLLPQPKFIQLTDQAYIIPKDKYGLITDVMKQYRNIIQLHWQIGNNYFPNIITTQSDALAEEGYTIEVKENIILIAFKTQQGLQHAINTLAAITKNVNGKLIIPKGIIKDEPSVAWRGIHMFTGPSSWQLHKRMYDQILFPLKMNKVVLQCEQAEWKSRPEIHNSISVPMKDLKAEFDYLRLNHTEPIPLIQSLGHMEWFFKPKENRFMAVNPDYPYTLNPSLPQAQYAVKQIWDETFNLLKPTTIHIGFDEIGMIGFNQPREKEIEYFKTQIKFLNNYAEQKKAKLMIWGDMGLAPGEGPDALNGVTKERAATIRSFIPAGTYIADWHYLNNPDPSVYKTNLQVWKQNNHLPIASPWLWPNNVRGFIHAAIDENAGVLQTTWADFESSEKNMLQNIEQFGAYILAMDYSWSGRKELPEKLPYNPIEEWSSRFYSQGKPIDNRNGWSVAERMQFQNCTASAQMNLPDVYHFKWNTISTSGFELKASTENILVEGTKVAIIQFFNKEEMVYEKDIRYAVDVRAEADRRNIFAHTNGKDVKTLFHFFQKKAMVTSVKIKSLHPGSGLTINKLILIE
jgi:hypothetical protein